MIMAIVILKTLADGQTALAKLGMSYIDCGTSGGVYGLERGYCLMVGGANFAVSACAPIFRALAPGIGGAPRTNPLDLYETSAEHGWLHCGPPGAGHFVKMVHNGVEYGIMQAYAEGFNILHEANAGSAYVKAGDAEVAPMENPEDYCYDIDCAEVAELWRRGSVVGSWLLDLTADVLRGNTENLISSMEGFPIAVRVAGLFMPLSIWVFPLLSFLRRCLSVLNLVVWALSRSKF